VIRSVPASNSRGSMSVPFRWCCLPVLMAGAACLGCGGSPFPMGNVTGRVTYGGEPLTSGVVYFLPQHAMAAVGPIDATGRYRLRSRREGDGAAVGRHRVFLAVDADRLGAIVPDRYRDPATSGWEVEVKPGDNVFDFVIPKLDRP
jgi:hypothetical protein